MNKGDEMLIVKLTTLRKTEITIQTLEIKTYVQKLFQNRLEKSY